MTIQHIRGDVHRGYTALTHSRIYESAQLQFPQPAQINLFMSQGPDNHQLDDWRAVDGERVSESIANVPNILTALLLGMETKEYILNPTKLRVSTLSIIWLERFKVLVLRAQVPTSHHALTRCTASPAREASKHHHLLGWLSCTQHWAFPWSIQFGATTVVHGSSESMLVVVSHGCNVMGMMIPD